MRDDPERKRALWLNARRGGSIPDDFAACQRHSESRWADAVWQHEGVTAGPLEALLVDVGGTLVNDASWVQRDRYEALMIERLRAALGADHPWFAPLVGHPFPEADTSTWEQRTIEDVRGFLAEQGFEASADEVERICRACAIPLSQAVELAHGALHAIRTIRDLGVRMVICSNTIWRNDADSLRDWEELGFGDYFDGYVTSHDTGFGKPHRAMFERALALVGGHPSRSAIVGDRLDLDIAGAHAIGMRSIWMRPPDVTRPVDPIPDAEVASWADVPPIIARWME